MRLKIPAPVQTWFNTLSTSNKRRPLAEEELDTSLTTNPASPSVATPLVIEALQNLCYEIFALPVCTAHAVTVAQTICGHIYGLAQSTDPSLQLLVLDLLPTLVHVYLVLSTTLSGGIDNSKTIHQAIHKSHSKHKQSITTTPHATEMPMSVAPTPGVRIRTSLRERLKKSSTASIEALRLNKSMRKRTQRLLKGLNPDTSSNDSNRNESPPQKQQRQYSSSVDSSLTANSSVHHLPSLEYKTYVETTGTHMTNLVAVLEALLLGLYNTFARNQVAPSAYSALPPFAKGSVFCGPLNVRGRREEQDGELVEGLLQLFSNKDPASLLIGGKKDTAKGCFGVANEEMELTLCNRWRILRLLCRLCSERIGDLTERGRAALCYLALLLGPYGLQEHRLPPGPDSLSMSSDTLRNHQCSTSIHNRSGHKQRWRGFARTQRRSRYQQGEAVMRTSTPLGESSHHKHGVGGGGGRIDLARITAPLRRGKLSVGGSKAKAPPEVNVIGPPNDHTDDSTTGLDSATTAATVAAAPNEEAEDNESRVVDELLLSLEDEDSEIVIEAEAASRSPTASLSIPQGADSSCTSSNSEVSSLVVSEDDDVVCSASSSDSSSVSSHSFPLPNEAATQEEADLCNAFGALNVVEEEEIPEDEEDGEETYQTGELPVNGSERQKSNNNEDAESGNGQDTKNKKNISNEPVAFPWREIPFESDVDEEIGSVRSTIDASLNSLNENSSIALQEKTPKTSRKGESEGRVKHKKSKRKHFYLSGGGGKPSGAVGVTVASARIPQLPPYFVLELLPGLHFILSTVQSPLAASAIQALTQRANLELWSNVLLYTNSICNSKLYYDATDKAKTLHLNGTGPCQMEALINRSNSIIGGRALSPSGSIVSSGSSHASSTLIRHDGEEELADHHQTTENSVLNRSHRKAPITNASFQVVRPEEDIPLVVDKPSQIKCTSLTVEIATRQRAKSLSPRHQSTASATSSALERVMEVPRVFHGLHCGGLCASGKTSRRHRTLSFNPRLCSALKTGRPKSPTNHKVTFVEEARESKEDNQSDASEPPHSA